MNICHVLELITRLKQICNADSETDHSSKLRDICDRLHKLNEQGHKALVFSHYTNETSGVGLSARYLHEFNPVVLTGDVPVDERDAVIDRFRNGDDHRVMIVSLKTGGVGLNLQEASYVFHLDRWWNRAVAQQAQDRAHRLGQTVKVKVIKYTCVNTIEEKNGADSCRETRSFS